MNSNGETLALITVNEADEWVTNGTTNNGQQIKYKKLNPVTNDGSP